jgi:hypothetical protein
MVNQEEYKEWFLTLAGNALQPLNPTEFPEEAPVDQDNPVTVRDVLIGTIRYPTIFKTSNTGLEPVFDDNVWQKFLKSITFKLNAADRALDSDDPRYLSQVQIAPGNPANTRVMQGLVTVSTDDEAKAWDDGDTMKYTRVPRVHQLPEVSADITTSIPSPAFAIQLIPASPTQLMRVTIDNTVGTHNKFLVAWSDFATDWLRDSFDAIKTYVDTVLVYKGLNAVTINGVSGGGTSDINIAVTAPTPTDTRKFDISLDLVIDDDPTLSAQSKNVIPSQKAVFTFATNLLVGINTKADKTVVDALILRVDTMEGGTGATLKANKTALDAVIADVANKLWKNQDDTMDGNLSLTAGKHIILLAPPVNPNDGTNKLYVDTQDNKLVPLDGSRPMTGLLRLFGNPVNVLDAVPRQYADSKIARAGDMMTGPLRYAGTPVTNDEYITKGYMESVVNPLIARIATLETQVANLLAKFNGGFSGVVYTNQLNQFNVVEGLVKMITT